MSISPQHSVSIALAWCLKYNDSKAIDTIQSLRAALAAEQPVPKPWQSTWKDIQTLNQIFQDDFPEKLSDLSKAYPPLCDPNAKIGLVYGGATKIKQYVFETENLQDIRGASAILDRINLVDLPAFFGRGGENQFVAEWLDRHYCNLRKALIPELIIYSTGGNILAFCPAAVVHELAEAIERYYTEVTMIANSCAVGDTFKLLEFRFGLLQDDVGNTPWLEQYAKIYQLESAVKADAGQQITTEVKPDAELLKRFQQQKNFNQLVTKLTVTFNKRRNGNLSIERKSVRCYPPMYETHPYAQRDDSDRRSAVDRVVDLPSRPKLSEASARKRHVGQLSKRDTVTGDWIMPISPDWKPGTVNSWVSKFLGHLEHHPQLKQQYYDGSRYIDEVTEARSLPEIGQTSIPEGYIAYIYADGNNMGQYIQQQIKTPQAYQAFSEDVFTATEQAVYRALARHLQPEWILRENNSGQKSYERIHPFEIIAIGGDDVFLVVPAHKALEIAQTIGEEFEKILLERDATTYRTNSVYQPEKVHRCIIKSQAASSCQLSLSTGVLITAENTPVYYAQRLVEQLLKSAKKRAKLLKERRYLSGTVDFLVMKSVTMVSSDLNEFRQQALMKTSSQNHTLKLYGGPYTLYELDALIQTAKVLKTTKFPKNQLYQIRSFLEQGKQTAILNYRYFQARLSDRDAKDLKDAFDQQWCVARSNNGNLAPWISILAPNASTEEGRAVYETVWWDLVDLYPFINDGTTATNIRARPKVKITSVPT
jgi:CRISPR-associated protein Cmr2